MDVNASEVLAEAMVEQYAGLLKDGWSDRRPKAVPGTLNRAGNVASDLADLAVAVLLAYGGSDGQWPKRVVIEQAGPDERAVLLAAEQVEPDLRDHQCGRRCGDQYHQDEARNLEWWGSPPSPRYRLSPPSGPGSVGGR